jgi:hypothetical protein
MVRLSIIIIFILLFGGILLNFSYLYNPGTAKNFNMRVGKESDSYNLLSIKQIDSITAHSNLRFTIMINRDNKLRD